ncbi:MAG: M20/M25/M40 family metallo-hydrolase, partial [Chloroflexota bacterium]
ILGALYAGREELLADLRVLMPDAVLGEPTISIGTTVVSSGVDRVAVAPTGMRALRSGVNAIPDWCEATIDVRLSRGERYPDDTAEIPQRVRGLLESKLRRGMRPEGWTYEVLLDEESVYYPTVLGGAEGGPAQHPLVASLRGAVERVAGRTPELAIAPGATEAAFLVHGARIPTLVEVGPAGGLSHQVHEYVEKDQIAEGSRILATVAMDLLGTIGQ